METVCDKSPDSTECTSLKNKIDHKENLKNRAERVCDERPNSAECKIAEAAWRANRKENPVELVEFEVFSRYFWLMLLIPMAGAMLTIGAKSMASNLSGATEGSGAAAGMAAGVTGAAGAAMAAPKMIGKAATTLGALAGPVGAAGAAAIGAASAVSGATAQAARMMGQGIEGGSGGASASPPPAGGGGGSGGVKLSPELTKQFQEMIKSNNQLTQTLTKTLKDK